MTGSSERVNKDGTSWYRTEYEPLGNQEVSAFEPEPEFPVPASYGEILVSADDPQWQCQMLFVPGNNFILPTRCGLTALADSTNWYGGSRSEKGNAQKISVVFKYKTNTFNGPHSSPSDKVLGYALRVTAKKTEDDGEGDCTEGADGRVDCPNPVGVVEVSGGGSIDMYVPGFVGADRPDQINEDEYSLRSKMPLAHKIKSFVFTQYGKEINDCVVEIFGVNNAKILGVQTLQNSPNLDLSRTETELKNALKAAGLVINYSITATFDEKLGPNGTIYFKKEYAETGALGNFAVSYIHELGNVLSAKLSNGDPNKYGKPGGILYKTSQGDVYDKDTGARLESCVGKEVSKKSTAK